MPINKDLYKQKPAILTTPFENIALAFSGGGFRAASFSLGVIAYLNNIKTGKDASKRLLENVTYISSSSGGTFTNALYALHKAKGKNFNSCYKLLFEAMDGEHILSAALDNINRSAVWKNSFKTRNIINAFSITYDGPLLFNKATLKDLSQPECKSHLEEVCFNSTDFFSGLPYKQQTKMQNWPGEKDEYFKFGNHIVQIEGDITDRLKLADLLAASSCFPGGYEPIVLPNDFCYDSLTPQMLGAQLKIEPQKNSKKEVAFLKAGRLGLMDGGITDNQGLESLMEADERRRQLSSELATNSFRPFDLIMVNDVGSFYMSPYSVPEMKDKPIALLSVDRICLLLTLILLAGIVVFALGLQHANAWLAVAGGLAIVFPALILFPVYKLHRHLTDKKRKHGLNLEQTFSETIAKKLIKFMRNTPMGILQQVNKSRLSSIMILTNDVFMKRIRQMLYQSFYANPIWDNRRKGNHIYDLSFSNNINRENRNADAPIPSQPVQIVAETACCMGTTLWFDVQSRTETHSMACIIATGAFTTCYNLIDYIAALKQAADVWEGFSQESKELVNNIDRQLQQDWAKFQTDPFFLFNNMGNEIWGNVFTPIDHTTIPFPEYTNYPKYEETK